MRRQLVLRILVALVGLLAVTLLGVSFGLPALVKWVAIHHGRNLLGREVSIERVSLDVWRGWYHVSGFRIAGRPGEAPCLEIADADLRIIYSYLVRGQLRAHEIVITSPVIRLARVGPGELSISDIIRRFTTDETKPDEPTSTFEVLADLILVSNGAILFEDRAVVPPRTFDVKDLTINLRDITTKLNAGQGVGTNAFVLNDTPMAVVARDVRIRPAHVKAHLNVVDFDVDEVWAYVPVSGAPVRPTGGRFSTSIDLVYDATAGATVNLETTVDGLAVLREGQTEPLAVLPAVKLGVRDLVARDGAVTLDRLTVETDATVVDESISPAHRYEVKDVRLVVEKVAYPSGSPASVHLTMALPEGATLDVRGTAATAPLGANLTVALANVDLALARPYIPPVSPITLDRGRLGATLAVAVTEGPAVRVNGEVVAGYSLLLRDQAQPFVEHPKVVAKIADLAWQRGAASLQRLTLDGPATIVDGSVSPPQRAEFTTLTLRADDVTWPVQRPIRLKSVASMGTSGTGTIEGTFNPATLAADIRARFADLDLTRAGPYIPPNVPIAITSGRLAGTVTMTNDRAAGVTVSTEGALTGAVVAHRGEPKLAITEQKLTFAVQGARVKGSAFSIRRASVNGAPAFADEAATPPWTLALRGLSASVRDVAWPARRPVPVELIVDLPEAGTLAATGSASLDPSAVDLAIDLKGAALAPYQVLLPFDGPIAGEASAAFTVAARMASDVTATGTGQADVRAFTLGPVDQPAVKVERVETRGVELAWPGGVRVDRVAIAKPAVLLERDKDGSFPLRAMLMPRGQASANAAEPVSKPEAPAPTPSAAAPPARPLTVTIREIAIEDGNVRFVDRSTAPTYSEEVSRVALTATNVTTAPGEHIALTMQAVVGATGALDLKGDIAPTADPFYLDVQGELREMPLPRSNPYFRQVFDWFLKRGSVSNKIHYRIVGDRITAENDVKVQRLGVEKDTSPVASDKKIGLPLGLIVAMVTDRRGDIEFSLPVSGSLKEPGFSVGGAVWAALKNVLTNMVTAPFQAIGKFFSKGDEAPDLKVEPVTFGPGSATVNAEGHQHLQRVADFLRASPNIRLELRPVVSADDLATLKTAEVTARIQRAQREQKLDSLDAAAVTVFSATFPGQPAPDSVEKIVDRLREQVPLPDDAPLELATKRVEATRQALVQAGGFEADRLVAEGALAGAEGQGRVEFELSPGGS